MLTAALRVGIYLADQLLLPCALAGGGGFMTLPLSPHAVTNIRVIEQFLDVRIETACLGPHLCRVEASRRCLKKNYRCEINGFWLILYFSVETVHRKRVQT